jgi:hypothetical protein
MKKLIKELPPAETMGKVIPVTGIIPMFIPMFINTWASKRLRAVRQIILPTSVLAFRAEIIRAAASHR